MKELVAFLCLAVFGLACGRDPVSASEFYGTWSAPDGAKMILNADGTATSQRLPLHLLPRSGAVGPDGQGDWSIIANGKRIIVTIDTHAFELWIQGGRDNRALVSWVGDPDNSPKHQFTREK
jgi:hypothetical protein